MATGKCVNIMNCSKARNKEIQEADKANFVCSECGKPLVDISTGGSKKNGGGTDDTDKKKMIIGIAAGSIILLGGAGAYFLTASPDTSAPTAITLNKSEVMGFSGDVDTLKVTATPENAKATYIWTSGNEQVATVQDGVVKLIGDGETDITVQVKGEEQISASCKCYVEGLPGVVNVEKMSFMESESDMQLVVGGKKLLNIDCTPGNANESVFFKSENTQIATVTDKGLVTAVAPGTTTITATTDRTQTQTHIQVKVKDAKTSRSIDLGFATYEGDLKNGKPEGNGTMTFKKRAVVPGSKGNVEAEPDEYAIGTWRNGEVNVVTLHKKDGNKPVLMHS